MGTVVTFDLFDPRGFDDRAVREAFERASAVLHEIDDLFSTWKPQSPMNRLRRGELDAVLAPAPIADVLDLVIPATPDYLDILAQVDTLVELAQQAERAER